VSTEEGDARGREAGVLFIETSAKAGFNIKARAREGRTRGRDSPTGGTHLARMCPPQALFRKIAAALPGMEALGGGGAGGGGARDDLIDVTLAPPAGAVPAASACSC
jgi:Ras-related protein Rab-6A